MLENDLAVELGKFAIFINTEKSGEVLLPYGEEAEVVQDVVSQVQLRLADDEHLAGRVEIKDVKWTRGCLITELTFVAVGVGVYTFVKDYPDLRQGLLLLIRDFASVKTVLKKSGTVLEGSVYSEKLLMPDEIKKLVADEKKRLKKETADAIAHIDERRLLPKSENIESTIIEHVYNNYVLPNKYGIDKKFFVVANRVKDALCLPQDVTLVCTILGSEAIQSKCNIQRTNITGPVNHPDMTFYFEVADSDWRRPLSLPLPR